MKIACLLSSLSRDAGGLYDSVRNLCRALAHHRGTEVHVLGMADEHTRCDAPGWESLATHVFPVRGPRGYGFAPGLKERLFALNADVLLTHGLWMYPTAVALAWHRRTGRPYMVSPHGMLDPWALRHSGWKKKLMALLHENAGLREAACVRALCEAEVDSIRARVRRRPVCLIPNGVGPLEDESSGTSAQSPTALRRKKLLYLGRLHPKKGLPLLLKAWALLQKSHAVLAADWELELAGWDQGGHEDELKRLVARWKIGDRVRFTGPLFGEMKTAAYRGADAFVLPSLSEGLPLTVLEAWTHGLPVLMTPQCHLPEGFRRRAAICAHPDAVSLAAGLASLFSLDDEQLRQMGRRGRQLVASHFAWPRIGAQMHDVCRWMLGEADRPECVRREETETEFHEPALA